MNNGVYLHAVEICH